MTLREFLENIDIIDSVIEEKINAQSDELKKVISIVQKISKHYVDNCGFTGVNLMNASGKSAQQSVFHLHFHIIPRVEGDGMNTWPKLEKVNGNFEKICNDLRII